MDSILDTLKTLIDTFNMAPKLLFVRRCFYLQNVWHGYGVFEAASEPEPENKKDLEKNTLFQTKKSIIA